MESTSIPKPKGSDRVEAFATSGFGLDKTHLSYRRRLDDWFHQNGFQRGLGAELKWEQFLHWAVLRQPDRVGLSGGSDTDASAGILNFDSHWQPTR
jgi:hypothetical protein